MLRVIFFFSFFFLIFSLKADNKVNKLSPEQFQLIIEFQASLGEDSLETTPVATVKFKRGKAILFTIFTGFLGGHRIYFGTHHRTPIIYSITFGGLGILPLIDLVNIIFTKDLSKFEHKSQIIMWGK